MSTIEVLRAEVIDRLERAWAERRGEAKLRYGKYGPLAPDVLRDEKIVDLIVEYIADSDQADGFQEDDLMLLHHLELMYDFLLYVREATSVLPD